MALVSTDLVATASATADTTDGDFESDSTPNVGGIGGQVIMMDGFLALSGAIGGAQIQMKSSNAADTALGAVNIRVRHASGVLAEGGPKSLNGTTPVIFDTYTNGANNDIERLLVALVPGDALGSITFERVSDGADLLVIPPAGAATNPYGWFGACYLFVNSFANSAGVIRYEKMSWWNMHATDTAGNPNYQLTADPQARIRQGVHPSIDDSATIATRLTAPAGVTFVDDNVSQSGSNLPGGAAHWQGVWFEFNSPANDANAPFVSTFTTQISFTP